MWVRRRQLGCATAVWTSTIGRPSMRPDAASFRMAGDYRVALSLEGTSAAQKDPVKAIVKFVIHRPAPELNLDELKDQTIALTQHEASDGGGQNRKDEVLRLIDEGHPVHPIAFKHRSNQIREVSSPDQVRHVIHVAGMVSGKLLIRALSIEHNLEPGAPRFGEDAPLREDTGAAIWLVLVPGKAFGQGKRIREMLVEMKDSRTEPGAEE